MRLPHKITGVIVICAAVLGLVYFIYTDIDRSGKISLTLDALPSDARITIGKHQVRPGTVYLEPGTYEVRASRDGFKDYVDPSLILSADRPERFYTVPMQAESEEAKQWLKDNEEAIYRVERLGYKALDEQNAYSIKKNPISKYLPYKSFTYSIGHHVDPDDPNGIIIDITAYDGYYRSALYRIRQLGYDPTDFKINFRDYQNPFSL